MVARWSAQNWYRPCPLASHTGGLHEVQLDFNLSKIEHIIPRPWIPNQQFGNPFWDWPQNFNFAFIFVFGFAIVAGEEHGLKDSLQRGRWFYFVTGCIFSGIKSGMSTLKLDAGGCKQEFGPYHWTYVHIIAGTMRF